MKSPSLNRMGGMVAGQISPPPPTKIREASDVESALNLLEKEISILNETISQLEERLSSVLNDGPIQAEEKTQQRDPHFTQLARQIDEHAAHVAVATFHLGRLTSRLGL